MLFLGVVLLVVVVVAVLALALRSPGRRLAVHQRSLAALKRSEERLDEISAEIDDVESASTNTRRAVRQKALAREARRAVRSHNLTELRVRLTSRWDDDAATQRPTRSAGRRSRRTR